MKRIIICLFALFAYVSAYSQANWTSTTVEGQKAYTITSADSKGNQCSILLFYEDYGFTEAWFTIPKNKVEHEDLPRFSVYWHFTYTENNKQETVELGGRNWSCIGNDKLDKKLETIVGSTIVVDGALGAAPFFMYITKSQEPVVLKLPTSSGDLTFTVPVLKKSKF